MIANVLPALGALILFYSVSAQDPPPKPATKNISGIWWSPDLPQSAAFVISDSTIYYPDHFAEFRYTLQGDSLLIYREDGVSVSRIVKVTPDTLILFSWEQEHIYTRTETQKEE